MLQDKLLILRLKRHRPDALAHIYEKYRLYLLKISVALLNDTAVAEDIVQDVFVNIARSGDTLKITGSLKGYLRVCVVNAVRNHFRRQKVRDVVSLDNADAIASRFGNPDQWVMLDEQSARISHALSQISSKQREVIVLHLYGGAKFREIATSQDVSVQTIQSRYRYGLEKLRSLLNGEVQK